MLSIPVGLYILPVEQCKGCFLFGHIKKDCNSTRSTDEHDNNECKVVCRHCGLLEHMSEFDRQKQIRQIMSFNNLSFLELT